MKLELKILALCILSFTSSAFAKDASGLEIKDARIFVPMAGSTMTAGYALVKNTSDQEIKLSIKEVKPFKAVESHETIEKEGRMAMQKIELFVIKPKETLELKPGGNHIMLFDPSRALKAGETLTVTFTSNGKNLDVPFKVENRMPKAPAAH
ncbi:MAG: copper chaperone PCu(A)C [Bdellovibrionota bacterium]